MPILALVRHGESIWNLEGRFTGWIDVPLTALGEEEARKGGVAMLRAELTFDLAYTSVLTRAHETLDIILAVTGYDLPVIRHEALNERHYGDLQGLSKDAMREQYSDEQVHLWRRSYDIPPPNGESLKDTAARTLPFYERAILQDIRLGKDVLVVAHGNSNRAIVMMLDDMSEDDVPGLELPTGVPLIYDLEEDGT
ncbi:MAG: 2,3-diphosphoglycerate-dependent phosphoglycerate mutase, partial [Actinomycetota bacterium]|nr:2,3-diphosphoglycerate-dependent phosphoglycerate mutase [Actinomycetota bacterium]